jgi:glyoxylase-like metal-dependent hydrolase (beta-lactamase superfamily II)
VEVAPGIALVDTLLGGREGITAAYLVAGPSPALVETGAQTSAPAVRAALERAGLAPADLAWLVLTHIHLDHCGGTGALAEAFPNATVVVHRRGARHLVSPERLVVASHVVYGETSWLYGGLDPVPEDRIVPAEDGQRIAVGPGRHLVMMEATGHARHHMAVLDEATGAVMAGDALGVRFPGAGLYPAVPPPDFDLDASLRTLARLRDLEPPELLLGHFGPVPEPQEAIALAERQLVVASDAALGAWRADGTVEAVRAAVLEALPLEQSVGAGIDRWRWLQWEPNNAGGLAAWAEGRSS